MKFLLISLLLLPRPTLACWEACPKDKECYLEDYWLTGSELEEMARAEDDGKCKEGETHSVGYSTGGQFTFTCTSGSLRVVQTNPSEQMKMRDRK